MGELDGKVGIVTGAGRLRGIGRATAVALAGLGADVVVTGTGRDPDSFPADEKALGWRDAESTAEQVRALGRRALPVVVDVSDPEQVETMVSRAVDEFGRVDILVNNAAYLRGRDRVPIVDLEPTMFQKVLDVKLMGAFLCAKAVVKVIKEHGQGGKIVNVSSGAGKTAFANQLAYNAACFGQIGLTQSMAKELGPDGINVNCVCPGAVDTSRNDVDGWTAVGHNDEVLQQVVGRIPIGRTGTDDKVGEFIAYLCTPAASWIHGQSINIDGGQTMEH